MSAYSDFGCAGLRGGVASLPRANAAALGVRLVLEKVGWWGGRRGDVGGRVAISQLWLHLHHLLPWGCESPSLSGGVGWVVAGPPIFWPLFVLGACPPPNFCTNFSLVLSLWSVVVSRSLPRWHNSAISPPIVYFNPGLNSPPLLISAQTPSTQFNTVSNQKQVKTTEKWGTIKQKKAPIRLIKIQQQLRRYPNLPLWGKIKTL